MNQQNQNRDRTVKAIALVKKDGFYFYIDQTGTPISDGRYTDAKAFSCGVAAVQIDGKWGYIDGNGDLVIPARFARAERFSEGLAAVSENGEDWGFVNRRGDLWIPIQKKWVPCGPFSNYMVRIKQDGRYGFMNTNGIMVIRPQFLEATDFHDCLAWVKVPTRYPWERNCGCVNTRGELEVPLKFWDFGTDFWGSTAVVPYLKYRTIDRKGNKCKILKGRGWDDVHVTRKQSWDRIHVSKWKLSPYLTSGDEEAFEDADVKYHGFIDWDGKLRVPCQWDDVKDYEEGFAAVQKDRRWGYIDKEGKVVIPCQWYDCEDFSCGLAAVERFQSLSMSEEEKRCGWGYIDKTGTYVIAPQFEWAGAFSNMEVQYPW